MSKSAILEVFDEYEYLTYYTVRRLNSDGEPEDLSETDKFYQEYDDPKSLMYDEFNTIVTIIDAMGRHHRGAEAILFRFEDAAHALPSSKGAAKRLFDIEVIEHSGLRLYCIRLTERIVILLGGGAKTEDKALNCPNVKRHFQFAQAVAKAIDEMLMDGTLTIEGKWLIHHPGDDEMVVYL